MNRWHSIVWAALGAISLVACSTTHEEPSQGQTHWLSQCDDDGDCGGALSCECGVCVAPCDSTGECSVEGLETQCNGGAERAVSLICEGAHERDLCLETCDDGDCPSGQRCVDDACVVEPAGSSGTDGGAPDADVLEPRDFDLGVANVGELGIVLYTGPCSTSWDYRLRVEGELLNVDAGCDCASADAEGVCPTPPPFCPEGMFHEVLPTEEHVFVTWDLSAWNSEPGRCGERVRVPDDAEVELTVCWLDEQPADPFAPLDSRTCQSRTFVPSTEAGYSMPVPVEPVFHLDD